LVDFLNFSLDGGDAETHYSSRGVKIFDRVAAMQASAQKHKNVRYNRAELSFIEAGGNDTKNPRCKAVEAVIACRFVKVVQFGVI